MKRIIITLIIAFVFLAGNDSIAQCKQQFVYSCAKDNGNAIYLRDFNVKLRKQKTTEEVAPVEKYSVVLNKGTKYRFNICSPTDSEGKAVLKLYDGKKKLGSTYNVETGKDLSSFDIIINKSAIYYVSIEMLNGEKGCAVGILSFVGKSE